jgi:hypothetical protein
VINIQKELQQAFADYHAGKLGVIPTEVIPHTGSSEDVRSYIAELFVGSFLQGIYRVICPNGNKVGYNVDSNHRPHLES